ncbi:MAG: AzlD domain-containing protein [Tissierellia bacterium]|nr:AzlD domain-containing protein [Tissierellia bacterium]
MSVYAYIFTMAAVTYMIRAIPLTIIRKKIESKFIRSFLYYVPYVTLSLIIFPSILKSTNSLYSALAGFITAVVFSYLGKSLFIVSVASCIAVFIVEII